MELVAKYVYKVYQERSFSHAARALYISQPALSAAISRLEKEMGIRIFDRSTVPISLTPQGQIYIESLKEIIESESNMRRKIRELSDMSYGALTVGGGSSTSYRLMSGICGEFYKRYPEIKVTLDIGNVGSSGNLLEKLKNRTIDLLITYTYDSRDYFAEPLLEERLVIAMHKKMKGAEKFKHLALTYKEVVSGEYDRKREIKDLSIFHDVGFFRFPKSSDTAHRMTQMLGDYKTAPHTVENAKHSAMHYNMMCAGIGAVVATDLFIKTTPYDAENILFFMPNCKESHRTVYIIGNRDMNKNPIAENFINVSKELCASGQIFKPSNV